MKQITFNVPVSAVSGNYVPRQEYTVTDDMADDMIRAGHATAVHVEPVAPVPLAPEAPTAPVVAPVHVEQPKASHPVEPTKAPAKPTK